MTTIKVLQAGLLTTIQDNGRHGYQKVGIPVSGVMDTNAYDLANSLVGNPDHAAVLEMTMWGGSYLFLGDADCAVSGADMQPTIDGKPISNNQVFHVSDGSILEFHPAVNGCRTYLAVAGGIDVPPLMGSRSTYRKCAIGGFKGRELRSGDIIPIGEQTSEIQPSGENLPPIRYSNDIEVRVIPGPQDDYFTENGLNTFFNEVYTVSGESDRMGCRLSGAPIESKNGTDIVSDGTVFGSIQITGAGLPIILMADRQTTGGYAKIATVVSEDLPLLAQAVPGTKVHFINVIQPVRRKQHELFRFFTKRRS